MTTPTFVLHADKFWISPYVFTCFVALREKGVPFEVKDVSLGDGDQRTAAFAGMSVTGRVPALVHGEFSLAESQAIVDYLEDVIPTPRLLPTDARERARARQVLGWVRSDLGALREERSTATMFYEHATKPLSANGKAAADKLIAVATRLLPANATTLFGEWCIADSDLAFMLQRLVTNGEDVPPSIRAYAEAQWKRASVKEFVEHVRPAYVPY
jgi:glutathione S-transferase